jgi:hypothetical protein
MSHLILYLFPCSSFPWTSLLWYVGWRSLFTQRSVVWPINVPFSLPYLYSWQGYQCDFEILVLYDYFCVPRSHYCLSALQYLSKDFFRYDFAQSDEEWSYYSKVEVCFRSSYHILSHLWLVGDSKLSWS